MFGCASLPSLPLALAVLLQHEEGEDEETQGGDEEEFQPLQGSHLSTGTVIHPQPLITARGLHQTQP